MKKFLAAFAALAALVACNRFQTGAYVDELVLPLSQEAEDSLFLSIDLEYVAKGMPKEAMEQVNNAIMVQAFDMETPEGTLEEAALRYREALIDEYLDQADASWEDQLFGIFLKDYRQWKNYLLTYFNYRGGAHGIETLSQLVFNRRTGEILTEAAFFADDYVQGITPLLKEAVKRTMEEEAPDLLDLVEMDAVAPNGNFSFNSNGVEWIFQPYEVGPYALGPISATVPWNELEPFIRR